MIDPELTPEDRLLKIIENPSMVESSVTSTPMDSFNLKTFWMWITTGKSGDATPRIQLRILNKVMLVICVILTFVCLVNFRNSKIKFDKMYEVISTAVPADPVVEKKGIAEDINFQQTLTMAKQHNIFVLDHPATVSEGLMVGQSQEIANLKLVGIMWSDKPQAMIEDVVDQKTYLLSVGDQVGRLTVKSIIKDRVVLGREDHIWELR